MPAIQGAMCSHVPPNGQDAAGPPGPASPSQPTLHTLPPPPGATSWPQCCPDGQSASVLQAWLTQLEVAEPGGNGPGAASLERQMQLNAVHTHSRVVPHAMHWQLN